MNLNKTILNKQLSNGMFIVRYEKRNGEVRTQIATRDMSIIPEEAHPKGANINQSDDIVRFYSVLDGGWRSFVIDNLIGISKEIELLVGGGLDKTYSLLTLDPEMKMPLTSLLEVA